jgi:hypothetical protein
VDARNLQVLERTEGVATAAEQQRMSFKESVELPLIGAGNDAKFLGHINLVTCSGAPWEPL